MDEPAHGVGSRSGHERIVAAASRVVASYPSDRWRYLQGRARAVCGTSVCGAQDRRVCASAWGNVTAACVVSVAAGWNITAVGAVADPLAAHYDASLSAIGLLGSALWSTHALLQAPAGALVDRVGARPVAAGAAGLLLAGNLAALLVEGVAAVALLRLLTGAGCGATMVCASLRVRAAGARGQGAVGGAVSAGGALAVATGPALVDVVGWRAPYVGGVVLAVLALVAALTDRRAGPRPVGGRGRAAAGIGPGRRALLPLGAVLGITIVLSFSLGNWIATILDRVGAFGPVAAGVAGATVLAGSVLTRPLGGVLVTGRPRGFARGLVLGALVAAASGAALLSVASSPELLVVAMVTLGLAAGLPFAAVVDAAARRSPATPGAAVGFVGTTGTLGGLVAIAALGPAVEAGAVREVFAALTVLTLGVAVLFAHTSRTTAR
ncbi:hypothetical protein C7Y72_10445 [Paraconexibacter algicola]|uniref:Major facilitator superfamily (MFS) profile domain-containing protein n=1 Tax=Paraconexibacter algicola TaxID=2133960 RepID=A0A2T4UNH6_9ACTN|nr:hypothetical protein C7Y72_10445 [Paraconexibacter algicola]